MTPISEKDLTLEIQNAYHAIAFPHVRTLAGMFERFEVKRDYKPEPPVHMFRFQDCDLHTGKRFQATATLSPWCSVRHAEHNLSVTPNAETLAYMTEHCIMSAHYVYNFQITIRDSGSALIACHPSQILASYWLAIVPAASLPAELFEADPE